MNQTNNNQKQNIEIAEIKVDIKWMKKQLNHLSDNQKWIIRTIIFGTLATIITALILKFI